MTFNIYGITQIEEGSEGRKRGNGFIKSTDNIAMKRRKIMRKSESVLQKGIMMGVLAVFMIAGILLLPGNRVNVKAAGFSPKRSEVKEYGDYKYQILTYYDDDSGEARPEFDMVEIVGYTENEGVTEITVPEKIEGYKVKSISGCVFENCSSLTDVILPNTVGTINAEAFKGCTSLKSIVMEGVSFIGVSGFEGCDNLENIVFSANLYMIDENAFKGTAWLKEQQKISPFVVVNGILVSISAADEYIEIPDSVTMLTQSAFSDCEDITRIKLSKNLRSASADSLHVCKNLKEILVDEENPNLSAEDGILYDKNKTTQTNP